jgi:hypothetical protein
VKVVRRDTRVPCGYMTPAERRALVEAQLAPLVVLGFGDEGLIGAEAIHQFLVGGLRLRGDNGKPIKNPRRLIDWVKRFPDWETVIIRPRTWKHRPWYTTKTRLLAWIFSNPWERRKQRRRHGAPERPPRLAPISVPADPYARRQRPYRPSFPDTDPETWLKV